MDKPLNKLLYISPSVFPSQAANTTHVILQTEALSKLYKNVEVIGIASRNAKNISSIPNNIRNTYDINIENIHFSLCRSFFGIAENLTIALYATWSIIFLRDYQIMTRNIYAAFFVLLLRKNKFIYETHTIETGFKKFLQEKLLESDRVETIVISSSLRKLLKKKYRKLTSNITILHDAARYGLENKIGNKQTIYKTSKFYDCKVGYFGSLLPGRGIDIIEDIASKMPNNLFLIYGPPLQNIEFENRINTNKSNIYFGGFIGHKDVHDSMLNCDILLMPYQETVSIDNKGSDTSKWMSPMKMFEYMATGKPIISSNLPVLREVLINNSNAILVEPSSSFEWINAIKRLQSDVNLSKRLGSKAHREYVNTYNWLARARSIKKIFD